MLESTGKFKIDFIYDELSNPDPHARKTIWKYNYLGIIPKRNSGRKHFEKYIETLNEENK
ncbi:antitoxin YezG family protein [Paenibacillus polymyxa]|uniref:antitoxin YezG family protein n=1 Tax=Paenibacillus polymyxa TaxID=1406 RepID=UPI00211DA007|nr:antitoxin YezG family protein [Paenibacillus polymyxa]UZP72255.1 antitoxin YezG family protein [Paenibacillus polymyxa]